jgi:diguanylate cyclase (GGDEF)-like protein
VAAHVQHLPSWYGRLVGRASDLLTWLFEWRDTEGMSLRSWVQAGFIALLLAATTVIIYATGGTSLVYVHLIYVPILVGGFFFGLAGGIVAGLVAGLCVGPWMPVDVAEGLPQTTFNWVARTGFFMLSGAVSGLMAAAFARHVEMTRRHGLYDAITELPNRRRLLDNIDALLDAYRQADDRIVVLTLGLAQFDTVLTTLGHRHADTLLRVATVRLQSLLSDREDLYDLGNGMFSVPLGNGDGDYNHAMRLADRLRQALQDPFLIEGVPVLAGGQCGIAQYPEHGSDSLALLRASIAALREAERLRLPYAIYDDRNDQTRREIASLLPDLHNALQHDGELVLHYQPKLRFETGECIGVEALIRWNHPRRGMVQPNHFIGLAEQTALIVPLTEWVIDTALRQLADWKQAGIGLSIAINASVRNLEDPDFPAAVANRIKFHGIDPSRLEVEVTESSFMAAPDVVRRALDSLRKFGVSIALDDFGTGHSSLTYLRDLPANTLKLDRSFLRDLLSDSKSRLIISSTIETAHQLGFSVVAEGIEDSESYGLLKGLACDLAQGYHVCRPLPPRELHAWLSARSSPSGNGGALGLSVSGQS